MEERRISTDEEFKALFAQQINNPMIEVSNCPNDGVCLRMPINGEDRIIVLAKENKEKLIADLNNLIEVQRKEEIAKQVSYNE